MSDLESQHKSQHKKVVNELLTFSPLGDLARASRETSNLLEQYDPRLEAERIEAMAGRLNIARRVQRKREKGWRAPAGAVYVGRPSRWKNPCEIKKTSTGWNVVRDRTIIAHRTTREAAQLQAVNGYLDYLDQMQPSELEEFLAPLRGHDLLCWCPIGTPCHADVLLRFANYQEQDDFEYAIECTNCGSLIHLRESVHRGIRYAKYIRINGEWIKYHHVWTSTHTCPDCGWQIAEPIGRPELEQKIHEESDGTI